MKLTQIFLFTLISMNMDLHAIRSVNTFCAQNNSSSKKSCSTNPAVKLEDRPDEFISSSPKPVQSNSTGLFNKFFGKAIQSLNPETQAKINKARLIKLFVTNGSMPISDCSKAKELLDELAQQDYNKVEKKYKTILSNAKIQHGNKKDRNYKADIHLRELGYALSYPKLEAEDIDEIYKLDRARGEFFDGYKAKRLELNPFTKTLIKYEIFDDLPANKQKDLIDTVTYERPSCSSITADELKKISPTSSLYKFDFIKDLNETKSNKKLEQKLNKRVQNSPCKMIPVSQERIDRVFSKEGLKNLTDALSKTDLTKYEQGFPLEYPRDSFIEDFNSLVEDLPNNQKKKVFNHFQFKIDGNHDIISFPNPYPKEENLDESIKDITDAGQKLVTKFMLKNRVKLDKEDRPLEKELNNIIKAYPEFISVMGKIQHRGDSIDFHTMDDMKRILLNKEFHDLPEKEQKILTTATLFHDFGKVQGVVDEGHAKKSALETKEIIKKTNYSLDDKERIYNLINHSHWLVEGSSPDDIAFIFRRPNDFKMAEIFEKADCNSAGFEYNPPKVGINRIKRGIKTINSNGIPIFANNLPTDDKYYDKTPSGIRYVDFREPSMSVEKYGYPKGTFVRNLKFLCHSSSDSEDSFKALCDDSKEICLSTSLLDYKQRFSTHYHSNGEYIVSGSNANIILGGKDVAYTGAKRDYEYAKDSMFGVERIEDGNDSVKEKREIIPNILKSKLHLSDKEYLELYTNICNCEDLRDIKDIEFSNGRQLEKEKIQQTINDLQIDLIRPTNFCENEYTNEFVVYNPKVEGIVLECDPEELDNKNLNKDNVYVLV